MVSGEAWAEYGLGPSGQVEAKTLRGPLIVWATKPGEGEDLPRLEAPTPSPLEVEAARLNMRPHFLAFVRRAQGEMFHKFSNYFYVIRYVSVKDYALWKVDRAARFMALKQGVFGACSFEVLDWIEEIGHLGLNRSSRLRYLYEGLEPVRRIKKLWYGYCLALRLLERAAYRAHVARRVRPPARRARIPRPIYARPRPPTAPLAPPVTC